MPAVLAAYRATVHDSTVYSPNVLMFGGDLCILIDLVWGGAGATEYAIPDEFVEAVQWEAYALARSHQGRRAERNKQHNYDFRTHPIKLEVVSWVWYYNPRRYVERSPKWQRNYEGSFMAVGVLSAVYLTIQKYRKANQLVVNIGKLQPFMGDARATWMVGDSLNSSGEGLTESPTLPHFTRVDRQASLDGVDNQFGHKEENIPRSVGIQFTPVTGREGRYERRTRQETPTMEERPIRMRRPLVYLRDYQCRRVTLTDSSGQVQSKMAERNVASQTTSFRCVHCGKKLKGLSSLHIIY